MADEFWGAFFVIAIVAFSIAGSATVLKYVQEHHACSVNTDCAKSNYCGSDFSCHLVPIIEHESTQNWTVPAAIIGLAIVIGAVILRKR